MLQVCIESKLLVLYLERVLGDPLEDLLVVLDLVRLVPGENNDQ